MAEQKDDHNPGGLAVFIFGMVASVTFFIYILFIHHHSAPDTLRNLPGAAASTEATTAK